MQAVGLGPAPHKASRGHAHQEAAEAEVAAEPLELQELQEAAEPKSLNGEITPHPAPSWSASLAGETTPHPAPWAPSLEASERAAQGMWLGPNGYGINN